MSYLDEPDDDGLEWGEVAAYCLHCDRLIDSEDPECRECPRCIALGRGIPDVDPPDFDADPD